MDDTAAPVPSAVSPVASSHEHPSGLTMAELQRTLPLTHRDRIIGSIRKGDASQRKFAEWGALEDLKEAVREYEHGLELSHDPYLQAVSLYNMGSAMESLFEETDSIEYLNRAIDNKRRAVNTIPENHPQRPTFLDGYGGGLQVRYDRTEELDDLESAITAVEEAIRATPENTAAKCRFFNNLSIALYTRFKRTSLLSDLERSVEVGMMAVESGADSPYKACHLNTLSHALELQFEWTGSAKYLNEAITYMEEAVRLTDEDDLNRPKFLHNLSTALDQRFMYSGSTEAIDTAIECSREAVRLSREKPSLKAPSLNGLGTALKNRFGRHSDGNDLIEAVHVLVEAVELTPDTEGEHYAARLTNLGTAMHRLYEHTKLPDQLTIAVEAAEAALEYTPLDHTERRGRLNNLGNALEDEYLHKKDSRILERAIECQQKAIEQTPTDNPDRAMYLGNLSNSLLLLFEQCHNMDVYERAVAAREEAAFNPSVPPTVRILNARLASIQLLGLDIKRASQLLTKSMELLPKTSPRNLSWSDSQHVLSQFPGIASDAAAAALECGSSAAETVQLLDSGRVIVLGHLLDIRSDLQGVPEELFERYENLRSLLDPPFQANWGQVHSAREVSSLHQAVLDFETLQKDIRKVKGCEYFGLPLPELEIRKQAAMGPIIFLNVSVLRADALIVRENEIIDVVLPNIDIKVAIEKVRLFQMAIQVIQRPVKKKVQRSQEYKAKILEQQEVIFGILEWLWDYFVNPVFERLGFTARRSEPAAWPRIWWSLTGVISFLPIHAAGYHRDPVDGRTVMDRSISSYTPSIRALKYSRDRTLNSAASQKALIVTMPATPGCRDLPMAEDEAYRVKYILAEGKIETELVDNAEVEVICQELPTRSIVHFICHAVSEPETWKSSLLFNDGSLMVARISQLKIPPGAVAYLSACSTSFSEARGMEDERIALSTAFQVAGFAGVVGCLWEVDDEASFQMATFFYNYLRCENARAAEALHQGALDLRSLYPEEPSIWAPYMYTGA